jgi:ribosomal-protein-serine acetyltransferase
VITAAVRICTNHALRVWGLQRVEIEAAVDNARSRAVAARLGFQSEGVRRQAHKVGERHHDVVVYSMLAPDRRA